jgi:hypothetical protein
MSQPTVVVVEDQGDNTEDAPAAFAAGVAAATSAQAAEEAEEAVVVAEQATEAAEAAVSIAAAADGAAWDAQMEVGNLRSEVFDALAEIRDMLGARAEEEPAEEGPAIPAPEVTSAPATPTTDDTGENRHGDETKYGAKKWFG